jgi:hypothetical protein
VSRGKEERVAQTLVFFKKVEVEAGISSSDLSVSDSDALLVCFQGIKPRGKEGLRIV